DPGSRGVEQQKIVPEGYPPIALVTSHSREVAAAKSLQTPRSNATTGFRLAFTHRSAREALQPGPSSPFDGSRPSPRRCHHESIRGKESGRASRGQSEIGGCRPQRDAGHPCPARRCDRDALKARAKPPRDLLDCLTGPGMAL